MSTAARRSRFVAATTLALTLIVAFPAHAPDFALLERSQQLRLHRRRDFADFVQEERAVRPPLRTGPPCRAPRR